MEYHVSSNKTVNYKSITAVSLHHHHLLALYFEYVCALFSEKYLKNVTYKMIKGKKLKIKIKRKFHPHKSIKVKLENVFLFSANGMGRSKCFSAPAFSCVDAKIIKILCHLQMLLTDMSKLAWSSKFPILLYEMLSLPLTSYIRSMQ